MIATHNQQTHPTNEEASPESIAASYAQALAQLSQQLPSTLLPSHHIVHQPAAGLNPLADTASFLFSMLGKLKQIKNYRPLITLQAELLAEVHAFEEQAKNRGYHPEYVIVCRYLLAATFDDVISHTAWGGQGQWDNYSLLTAFHQDTNHQEKFFAIMERAVKDPKQYIDLMEVMYLCLSMGYKGQYRGTEHNQYQLDLITNNLYQYIRMFRGHFSKQLSPAPLRPTKGVARPAMVKNISPLFIFLVTASIIMIIFITLGYLMDVISNEAYKDVFSMETTLSQPMAKQ